MRYIQFTIYIAYKFTQVLEVTTVKPLTRREYMTASVRNKKKILMQTQSPGKSLSELAANVLVYLGGRGKIKQNIIE
jgi:hypothetical protein